MDFRAALQDLDARQPESMPDPSLDRITALADLLNHPELTYPTVHITGTNGKTTTAQLVTALTCAHGLTTGTFVSPHVERITERVSVCGEPISEGEFAEEYGRLLPYLERVDVIDRRVTYFEALTCLAYLWFSDKPIGLGVFEVGMGGKWDATNLVRGDVAVLCPIGLDHPQLGSTVQEVAVEKAGIVKEGRTAVTRRQRPEAMRAIEARAGEMGATLLVEGDAFELEARAVAVGGQSVSVRGTKATYPDLFVPLFGEQAARNVGLAIAASEALLGRALDQDALAKALEGVRAPGRLEVVRRRPLVVLDGAHNPDAMSTVAAALPETFRWERLHLVTAMFSDKDIEAVLLLVAPLADRAYACSNSSPRSAPVERVATALEAGGAARVETHETVPQALAAAFAEAEDDDLVLVTGSFYTVADARPLLLT